MTGTTVTSHLHWRKRNQHVMNQPLSTSISGKPASENLAGEGGVRGSVHDQESLERRLSFIRILSCDAPSPASKLVMPGLVPGIHAFLRAADKDVDGRDI
jgi:hypothetical protein